jgi:protein O-GlcNAc transferase
MGIFDRFRSAGQVSSKNTVALSEQDATLLIEEGHALEANGRLDEAMRRYLDAIRLAPNPARAHLNHGNVLLSKGDLPGALNAFGEAIKHKPDYAGAYYNIGNALLKDGQPGKAVESYRRALEIKPDYAEAHCALGVALKELGQFDGAVASFKSALAINPNLTEAHASLDVVALDIFGKGNDLMGKGQLEDAVENYRRVLEIKHDNAEAHCNMGLALQGLGRLDQALASYNRALEIKPDLAEAHNNLGNTLKDSGQLQGALDSYRHALKIKPGFAMAYNGLGAVLIDLGQLEEAAENFRRALRVEPRLAEALNNLGLVLHDLGQLENALESYRHALKIKPDFAEAHNSLSVTLQNLGQFDSAEAGFRRALEIKPDYADAYSNLLFFLNYTAKRSPSYYLDQAREYGRIVSAKVSARFTAWQCAAQPQRLRVGLVSGDLRSHSVGYFLEGLLANIDPAHIELIAYPTQHKEDELTARIRPYFSAWKPLTGKSDEAAARLIHADGVHILFDLSGHTAHNRLPVFAWKPAPVQVTWLGLPATTGVAEMDYVLGDIHAIPAEYESHFSEKVWRMPETCLCLAIPASPVNVAPLPALSSGYVTFGSFNNLTKMNDAVVAVWSRLLDSVPGSRLLLKTKQLSDAAVCEQTLQRFAACGIAPERLILSGQLAFRDDHLDAYNKVDIALDTFPYPGVTTSVEALWMGVPVLSLQGDRFLSRTAGSIAVNAGLPDWIAADEDDYVDKAVRFAENLERLAALRASLRERVSASPLFDAKRFARNFEDALWGMWQEYQAQHGNLKKAQ